MPVSDLNLQVTEEQQQALPPVPERPPVRRSRSRSVTIISGLIILILLVLLASTVYFYSNHQASANTLAQSQTATALAQTPTHTSTGAITPTAPPQKGLYIAGTYNGSMFDQTAQQTSYISVHIVQSNGNGAFSGTFTITSPSQGVYPLSGTVDTQGNFSFTVQQPAGQTPLYFHGAVQQGVYLHGNFCSSSTNSCSTDTGYFTVGPRY